MRAAPFVLPHFSRAFLIRPIAIWALVRPLIAFAGGYAAYQLETPGVTDQTELSVWSIAWLVAGVALASYLWMWRCNEIRFLRLLGVPSRFTAVYVLGVPIALELVLAVATR